MNLLIILRKKRQFDNFSIEAIFNNLNYHFKSNLSRADIWIAPCFSNGVLPRLFSIFLLFWKCIFNITSVVHITGDVHFLILAVPNSKKILTVHDVMLLGGLQGYKRFLYKLFWYKLPFKVASIITTVSEATKLELLREFPEVESKLRVIPAIVDFRFKRLDKDFNCDCPVVLIIGTAKNKNFKRVLEALVGLNVVVIIIGKVILNSYPELNSLRHSVFVNLSTEDLIQKYNEADIVCCCSMTEGFGLPLIEAQIVGRPLITGDRSSMPEVAGSGAVFVNPYSVSDIRNGIQLIINNSDLRTKIVEEGFSNSRRFCHEVVAKQYISLYNEL